MVHFEGPKGVLLNVAVDKKISQLNEDLDFLAPKEACTRVKREEVTEL